MRRALLLLLLFVLLLATPIGLRYLRYYGFQGAAAEAPPAYDLEQIPAVPTPATNPFTDEPVVTEGFVLLDFAHANDFQQEELSYLDGRLAARGYEMLLHKQGDLSAALRPVSAFIVVAPLQPFSEGEVRAVADFVERGGRLLLVGDPTRFELVVEETETSIETDINRDDLPLNSLANEFGIVYRGDYLYNTTESEGNYRNIFLRTGGFGEDPLTAALETIVFYGSHSLQLGPSARPLLQAGEDTWSSETQRSGQMALGALAAEDRVLALGDLNFFTEPYNNVYDNGQFIARVADFLVEADRNFTVADFPFFYQQAVDLVYSGAPDLGPDAFDEVIALQDAFRQVDRQLALAAAPQAGHDVLYLGLYNQAEDVAQILDAAGIELVIEPPLPAVGEEAAEETSAGSEREEAEVIRQIRSDLGDVRMSGTALILLQEEGEQRNVVVLAASGDGLERAVERLLDAVSLNADSALSDCLLQGALALCPTSIPDEPVESELDTSGTPVREEEPGEVSPDAEAGGGVGGEYIEAIDATLQGTIGVGQAREGALAADESHAWSFNEGPATIDVILEAEEEMDAVLEIYDAGYELVASVDNTLSGETERLLGVEIESDDTYTIVVRDFFGSGGSYRLIVEEAGAEGGGEVSSVFIYSDDQGNAALDGVTGASAIAGLLGDEYTVTSWIGSSDGELQEGTLDAYDLVIWTSGDFRREADLNLNTDTLLVLDYFLAGGNLLVVGATPPFLEAEGVTVAPLTDLEVSGQQEVILDGFEAGAVLDLSMSYETTLIEEGAMAGEEGLEVLFSRGPESENAGGVAGVALQDQGAGSRLVLLAAPFVALPSQVQEQLLTNLLAWYALS